MNTWARKTLVVQIAAALGAANGVGIGVAIAQTPPAAKSTALEEIVVTAQRRAENKQEIPLSVTAITADELSNRNITDLSQMEGVSPGFTFGRSGSDARPAMRGVRTENVAVNGDTTIGFFVDGVYKSRSQQALSGFVDIARVEIQRGPQGTLYGRNTFGGNISIITNEPIFGQFQSSASLLFGAFKKARVEGVLNIPASDTVAIRLAGAYDKADGYVKNSFNPAADLFDQDLKYGRLSVRFKPNSQFDATFRTEVADQGGNGGSAFGYKQGGTFLDRASCLQLFNSSVLTLNVRGGNRDAVNDCTRTVGAGAGTGANAIGAGVDLGIPIHAAGNAYRIDTNYQSFQKLTDKSSSLDMAYKFDAFTFKSITGTADFKVERTADSDMSASQVFIDYQLTKAKTFSQELQILSGDKGPLGYVAGYYYFAETAQVLRVLMVLGGLLAAAGVAWLSAPGKEFFAFALLLLMSLICFIDTAHNASALRWTHLSYRQTTANKSLFPIAVPKFHFHFCKDGFHLCRVHFHLRRSR